MRVSNRDKKKLLYADVVAFWLKDAGYDLMELVNEHIIANRDLYIIDVVGINHEKKRQRSNRSK